MNLTPSSSRCACGSKCAGVQLKFTHKSQYGSGFCPKIYILCKSNIATKITFLFFSLKESLTTPHLTLRFHTFIISVVPVPHKKLQSIIYVWGQETLFSTRLQHLSWCFLVLSDCVTSKSLIFDLWVLKKEGYQISSSHQETEWVLRTDRSSRDMLSRASTPSFQEDHHPWVVHGL